MLVSFGLAATLWLYLWVDSPVDPTPRWVYMAILSGVAVFGWAATWRPEPRANLLVAVVSVLVSIYGIEALLMVLAPPEAERPPSRVELGWIESQGIEFDRRSQIEVIDDLRHAGHDAWPAYFPGYIHEPLYPLGGISRVTTVYGNETGEFMVYESDEHGFHNPIGVHQNRDVDCVLIGDSFTHGCCVGSDQNVAGRLRSLGHRVVNLGMGENGPLEELAIFREFVRGRLEPKVVLWLYYEENDLADLEREQQAPFLARYSDPAFSQELFRHQPEVDRLIQEFLAPIMKARRMAATASRHREASPTSNAEDPDTTGLRPLTPARSRSSVASFFQLDRLRSRLARLRMLREQDATLNQFISILRRVEQESSAWGGRLVFVYLPEWRRYAYPVESHDEFRDRRGVLSAVDALGIPIIDFHTILGDSSEPLEAFPFERYGHYTERGYQWLAEQIDAWLKSSDP